MQALRNVRAHSIYPANLGNGDSYWHGQPYKSGLTTLFASMTWNVLFSKFPAYRPELQCCLRAESRGRQDIASVIKLVGKIMTLCNAIIETHAPHGTIFRTQPVLSLGRGCP